ncbi:hypothetical protein BD779DRAFT_1674265 [Infundibulicybe gibba]|nr:hypothetical protein BD779DRAFT_1674265 [Infundibulicybe gibba]
MTANLTGHALTQLLTDAKTTNYLVAAAITLLVWVNFPVNSEVDAEFWGLASFDHVLTIDQEVALVWKSRWNLTSSLYIWNRYYALIVLILNASFMLRELEPNKFEGITASILVNTVDVILAIRVWILYEKNRKILFFFVIFISAEFITMFVLAIITVSGLKRYFLPFGCGYDYNFEPGIDPTWSDAGPLPSFVMFVMTIYRCGATLLWNNQRRIPIISLFLRDGVFWFIAVLVVLAPEILTTAFQNIFVTFLQLIQFSRPTLAVYTLIGSRVLLNIMALVADNEVLGTMANGSIGDQTMPFRATRGTDFTDVEGAEALDGGPVDIPLHEGQPLAIH